MRFEEDSNAMTNQLDFAPRAKHNAVLQLIIAFACMALVIVVAQFVPSLHDSYLTPLVLVILLAIISIHVVTNYQKNIDLVMTTEFQNLLFTQGLALGCTFCLFVKRDGTIVYATDGMYRLMGSSTTESQLLDAVFQRGGVLATDRERVMSAIYSTHSESLIFVIPEATNPNKKYVMTVEPFSRPQGYSMVRVREFREERVSMPGALAPARPSSAAQESALKETPVGLYSADAYGQLTYMNPAFASFLGYTSDEMLATRMTLAKLLNTVGERTIGKEYNVHDYTGPATFHTRHNTVVGGMLFQCVIRDERSKITAATGSIIPATLYPAESDV